MISDPQLRIAAGLSAPCAKCSKQMPSEPPTLKFLLAVEEHENERDGRENTASDHEWMRHEHKQPKGY